MYWRYFRVSPHRVNADPLSSRGENEEEKRRSMTLIDLVSDKAPFTRLTSSLLSLFDLLFAVDWMSFVSSFMLAFAFAFAFAFEDMFGI